MLRVVRQQSRSPLRAWPTVHTAQAVLAIALERELVYAAIHRECGRCGHVGMWHAGGTGGGDCYGKPIPVGIAPPFDPYEPCDCPAYVSPETAAAHRLATLRT